MRGTTQYPGTMGQPVSDGLGQESGPQKLAQAVAGAPHRPAVSVVCGGLVGE